AELRPDPPGRFANRSALWHAPDPAAGVEAERHAVAPDSNAHEPAGRGGPGGARPVINAEAAVHCSGRTNDPTRTGRESAGREPRRRAFPVPDQAVRRPDPPCPVRRAPGRSFAHTRHPSSTAMMAM